ncbi:MAG: right-handed parallel beta-helix repeat-containing protein [Candidatus Nitrotoga sp.]|nr:right-handed parallel beta-helix repeat-containing protein [Candidatus Nitrotoga sp.]MDP1855207.1 right-handed parallel beta-helix repeat-containing protein [Candidatus Nitrotoga sp.]MDP3497606.1 right-handed parallel beta-helix repeat-containing protein [Candidatus Nitrotoga sp.]
MLRNSPALCLLVLLCATITNPANALVQRAFVASYGSDSNAASDCQVLNPCRMFTTAVTVVAQNGEVVALDTAAYGIVTLTQSISLTAAPGVYAGVSVFPGGGTGITIATPNVNVVLRGLTINGQGGNNGVLMTAGSRLSIENCVISNFNGVNQFGVLVDTAATVRIVDTLVRDNDFGIEFRGGATADISGSKFLGNSNVAIYAHSINSTTTTVAISDTVVTGGGTGIEALSTSGNSRITMVRTTITNATEGIAASASGGTATLTLSDSMLTGNAIGYVKGSGGTITSLVNNIITDNTSNTGGALSTTPLL